MEIINIDSKKLCISDFDFFDICIAADDVNALYQKYASDEKEIYSHLVTNSRVYILFNKFISKFNYKFQSEFAYNKTIFNSFAEAEKVINSTLSLAEVFNQKPNVIFNDDFCFYYSLSITKDNRLMFISRTQPIFNESKVTGFDFRNIILTPIQIFKMVNRIKNYEKAVELLAKELNIEILGEEMIIKNCERNKIVNNLGILNDLERYPNLNKMIKRNKFVLEAINIIGINNTFSNSEHTEQNDMIILCTSNYLKDYLNEIGKQIQEENQIKSNKTLSEAYLRRLMILYTNLGLINITNPTEKLLRREKKNSIKTKSYKYYTISEFSHKTLLRADELAKIYLDNGINASNITNSKVTYALTGKKTETTKKDNNTFYYDFSIKDTNN